VPHALQRLGEDDVEAAASIEHLGEASLADHRADHKWISAWVREVNPVVASV
jgi:hypothetical protein